MAPENRVEFSRRETHSPGQVHVQNSKHCQAMAAFCRLIILHAAAGGARSPGRKPNPGKHAQTAEAYSVFKTIWQTRRLSAPRQENAIRSLKINFNAFRECQYEPQKTFLFIPDMKSAVFHARR
jgi:hypothetical protein